MIGLFFFVGTAWPCAALLTRDGGALATSDAQEVILERNDAGLLTQYRVSYDGDAEDFGWLIVVEGAVAEGDVNEADEAIFEDLREATQPTILIEEYEGGGGASGSGGGCGRGRNQAKSAGSFEDDLDAGGVFGDESLDQDNGVDITAEGFAGPFAYTALAATDADALVAWLDENEFSLGATAPTLEHYIEDGNYTFVAVSLSPDTAETPDHGRTLPALAIQSDADRMSFPARMSLTGMAEELRTTVWVVGDETAEIVDGWSSVRTPQLYAAADPVEDYDEMLRQYANLDEKSYATVYSGSANGHWVTRFDTLAHRSLHTTDPEFEYTGISDAWRMEIIVAEGYDQASIWFWLSLCGMGLVRRRNQH